MCFALQESCPLGLREGANVVLAARSRDTLESIAGELDPSGDRVLTVPTDITDESQCELEALCHVGSAWQRINSALRVALADISLADLGRPAADAPPLELGKLTDQPRG